MNAHTRRPLAMIGVLALLSCVSGCFETQAKRVGSVIGIRKEQIAKYKRLHSDTWPGVLRALEDGNVTNYSIYLGDVAEEDRYYLFSYFEYTGDDYDGDMTRIGESKAMREWWNLTDSMQTPLPTREEGEWWSAWEEVFHHDGPEFDPAQVTSRHGAIIGLREDAILEYTQFHAAVWPGVLETLDRINIRNYSIYLGEVTPGEHVLFAYYEYIGEDFDADMENMADEVTKAWWKYCDPLQIRLPGTPEGEQWKAIPEVFHHDY